MTKTALARIDEIVASGSASASGRLSALAASLALAVALLLTPGGGAWGQDAWECQAAGQPDNSGTISCADQAWSPGIYHSRGDSAASLALTVGGGMATTITASGGGDRAHGIGLDSGSSPSVAGTQSLTVGSAGAVSIVDDNSGTSHGILARRGGTTNGGTFTVDIRNTVTIGTSSARMLGSGIWSWTNPTATVTFTTAATIYSTQEGIDLHRGNNSTGTLTLTNTGAVDSTANAIHVRNGTGSSGAITVTNSGALTTANNAIDVVTRGTAAMTVTNSGDLTAGRRAIYLHADDNGAATLTLTGGRVETAATQAAVHVRSDGTGAATVTLSGGEIMSMGRGIYVQAQGNGAATLTLTGGTIEAEGFEGIYVESRGTGAVTIQGTDANADTQSGPTITSNTHGIHVRKVGAGATAGDISIATTGGAITAGRGAFDGILVDDRNVQPAAATYTGNVVIDNAAGITAGRYGISVIRSGAGSVSVTNRAGTVEGRTEAGIRAQNMAGDASDVTVSIMGGTVQSIGQSKPAVHARSRGSGDVIVTVAAAAALNSKHNAGVFASLDAFGSENQATIDQAGAILGRTGVYARVASSVTAETPVARDAADQPVIDITWTGTFMATGSFAAAGTTRTVANDDNERFYASDVNSVIRWIDWEVEAEKASDGVYGGAAGIEAQVMSWRNLANTVSTSDDPGEIADAAAQMMAVPTGATAADNVYIARLRAALENDDIDYSDSVFASIGTGGDDSLADLGDAEIVTYLQANTTARRTLLRNILRYGLSDAEKAVLKALSTGDSAALTAALEDAEAAFSDDYKTAMRALLDRYHVGDIRIAMNGGSIMSRGDGIRAYYATPNANNGAIDITVAAGTTVTGARAGIWVAHAGGAGTAADMRKQTVTVNGMVTGGTDAAVHLVGGGTLTLGETGVLVAGEGQPAVLVNDPGYATIRIDGEVRGGDGAMAALDLSGGGSVTVTPTGSINTNEDGADSAIRVSGGAYRVAVYATGTALTRNAVNRAIDRVQGGIVTATGGTVTTRPDADGEVETGRVSYAVVETAGEYTTGRYLPLALNDDGEPVIDDPAYAMLPTGCAAGQNFEDGRCVTPPPPPEMPMQPETPRQPQQPVERPPQPMLPLACNLAGGDCGLYEALPSVLLAMNGLPSYDERMASARSGSGGWARVETARGDWTAEDSTQPNLAYDYDRSGVRAGVDMAVGENGRIGMAMHALKGSADLTQSGGKVELAGMGVGVTGTAMAGAIYIDAQAAATWYDVEVAKASGMVLKKDASGTGYALALEAGRPMMAGAMGENGVTVTPRAGFAWSRVSLDDFTDALASRRVSVDDASSLKGRLGVTAQTRTAGGTTIAASMDAMREFQDETETMFEGTRLKASTEPTSFRIGLGLGHNWGDNNHTLQASAAYTTGGGNNSELAGGLSLSIRF